MQQPEIQHKSLEQNVLKKNPVKQALLLIDKGDYRAANHILRDALKKDPTHKEAVKWMAYCFEHTGQIDNAILCYRQFTKLAPGEESHYLLGKTLMETQQRGLALEEFKKALGYIDFESPYLFEIYKEMGNILLSMGDHDGAEENYNRAFTLSPHSDVLLVNFGTLEIQRQDYTTAAERYRQALSLNQLNERAWVGLSMCYRSLGDYELAWGAVEKALDINSLNVLALRLMVEWALQDLTYGSAIQRLKNYLARRSDDPDMSFCLAVLLCKTGHYREAKIENQRVLNFSPERKDAVELDALIQDRLSHA